MAQETARASTGPLQSTENRPVAVADGHVTITTPFFRTQAQRGDVIGVPKWTLSSIPAIHLPANHLMIRWCGDGKASIADKQNYVKIKHFRLSMRSILFFDPGFTEQRIMLGEGLCRWHPVVVALGQECFDRRGKPNRA